MSQSRLHYDECAKNVYELQSKGPGAYRVSTPGFMWADRQEDYTDRIKVPIHQIKQYPSASHVDTDSKLRFRDLTNPRHKTQLRARPPNPFKGAGSGPGSTRHLESELIMGVGTRGQRACDGTQNISRTRFHILPEYGNPQRVEHVVQTGIRGGANTRDDVRKLGANYYKKVASNIL